jgi:hypothetical protein
VRRRFPAPPARDRRRLYELFGHLRPGYTLFHTDNIWSSFPGAWHDAIAGCLTNADPPKRICGPTLLDTGTVGIFISSGRCAANFAALQAGADAPAGAAPPVAAPPRPARWVHRSDGSIMPLQPPLSHPRSLLLLSGASGSR